MTNQEADHELGCHLRDLRKGGWHVALHFDSDANKKFRTTWLFIHKRDGCATKGEGSSDLAAVRQVVKRYPQRSSFAKSSDDSNPFGKGILCDPRDRT